MTEAMNIQPRVTNTPVRNYKDRVFRMIFKEKREFLELYNALNESDYDNPEDLIVTALDNAIYMGIKNDVSFLLYDKLTLYEHQATDNPNMPLRNLLYVADIYSRMTKDANLHGTKLIRIPEPQFIVFYNGKQALPERQIYRLSDAYKSKHGQAALELSTLILNVNYGYNRELMEKCRTLQDYAMYVGLVREYEKEMPFELAVEQAIDECIERGILAEFLEQNRAEVLKVSIYEYDQEKHIQQERSEAREEGRGEGRLQKLVSQVCRKLRKGKSVLQIADELEEDAAYIEDICRIAECYAPDYDEEKVYKAVVEKR